VVTLPAGTLRPETLELLYDHLPFEMSSDTDDMKGAAKASATKAAASAKTSAAAVSNGQTGADATVRLLDDLRYLQVN
jgi:hypothetical protein